MIKNTLLLLLLFFSLSNCSKQEREEIEYTLMLEGEWICETNMQWEVMEFSRNGKCFYYNGLAAWNVENIHKYDGVYFIQDNAVTGNCYFTDAYVELDFTILEISENEFEAKHNNTGIVKKYHRVIQEYELTFGESKNVNNTLPLEFMYLKSHNDNIVSINDKTGDFKAENGGYVLIDVVDEDNGISYIKVKVNGIMDLTPYLGIGLENVFTLFGTPTIISEESESVHYSIRDNLVDYIQYNFSTDNKVESITLKLVDGALMEDIIIGNLDKLYTKTEIFDYFYRYRTPVAEIAYFPAYNKIFFRQS